MNTIPVESYIYPEDKAALDRINKVPGIEKLMKFISKNGIERFYDFILSSSMLKITDKNSPKVYDMYRTICERFDLKKIPDVYVSRDYSIKTTVFGADNPKIMVNSAVFEEMNERELEVFLSSDIAGIKAGHGIMSMVQMVVNSYAGILPVPKVLLTTPLNYWSKQKYYTYDRARMIYSDDYELVMKLTDYGNIPEKADGMNARTIEERLSQSEEFRSMGGISKVSISTQTLESDIPWNADRAVQLFNWVESGLYSKAKEGLS